MASRAGRSWRGWAAATLIPATVAVAFVLLAPREGRPNVPVGAGAPALARLADLPSLQIPPQPRALNPIVPVAGHQSVRVGRFEPLSAASGPRRLAGSASPPRMWTPGSKPCRLAGRG